MKPIWPRFFGFVPKAGRDECWLWTGNKGVTGYGVFTMGRGNPQRAHRVSWEIHNGPIPEGKQVLHSCDARYQNGDITYRACVNPRHLWLGDHDDNMADMMMKGRRYHLQGEEIGNSKLRESVVLEIRGLPKKNQRAIAKKFGVSQTTVWAIQSGKTWRHLK